MKVLTFCSATDAICGKSPNQRNGAEKLTVYLTRRDRRITAGSYVP